MIIITDTSVDNRVAQGTTAVGKSGCSQELWEELPTHWTGSAGVGQSVNAADSCRRFAGYHQRNTQGGSDSASLDSEGRIAVGKRSGHILICEMAYGALAG